MTTRLEKDLQSLVERAKKDLSGYAALHEHLVVDPDPKEQLCYVMVRVSSDPSIYFGNSKDYLTLDVMQIFVPPAHRKKGLCKRTLQQLAKIAEQEGRVLRVVAVISKDMESFLQRWTTWWKKDPHSNTWWCFAQTEQIKKM